MDLAVYLRVLGRHRKLVAAGVVVALLTALVSFVRFDFDGVKPTLAYKEDEVWLSASTLFVTQEGFPWGRSILDDVIRVGGQEGLPATFVPRYGDPSRYSGLAQLYTALARSDAVERAVMRKAPRGARYEPEVAKSSDSTVLPLIYMKGYGPSPAAATAIANRAATTFSGYLAREQARNKIPPDRRVKVTQISRASQAEIFAARSMVRPVFVFMLVVMVFVALAFVVENVRLTRSRSAEGISQTSTSQTNVPHSAEPLPAGEPLAAEPPAAPARRWA